MSRHHIAQKWSTHSPKLRKDIKPLLPLPCISKQCKKGGVVHPTDDWHVGHRIDAAKGGRPTKRNTGPIHKGCNLRDGGALGAAVVNARRASQRPASEMKW